MASCNTVLPKDDKYFSSNPDDLEFVNTAKKYNHELVERAHVNGKDAIKIRILNEAATLANAYDQFISVA